MTPERLIEIEQGVPLSDPSPYTRVIQECVDRVKRLQAEKERLIDEIKVLRFDNVRMRTKLESYEDETGSAHQAPQMKG